MQVSSQVDKAAANEAAADRAEEDASVAMRSAETGVREEMEAAAVVKETESALTKALAELTFLETSYEEKEFESDAQKVKAKAKAQKQAEIAVKDALASVNSTTQTATAHPSAGELHLLLVYLYTCVCRRKELHCFSSNGGPRWAVLLVNTATCCKPCAPG